MTPPQKDKLSAGIYTALTLGALWWSLGGLGVDFERLSRGLPRMGLTLKQMFAPPSLAPDFLPKVGTGLIESLQIAALGTALSAIFALPFGVLAARNLARLAFLPAVGKLILNAIRTFPDILLAIGFISALGPGAFPGVMAVAIHSIGMLGKLYAERIETVDKGAIEALQASGASAAEVFRHGIVPEVLPDFLSYALYRFDLNVRAASILGLVGAGGIGTLLELRRSMGSRAYPEIGTIILGTIITVGLVDFFSAKLRAKLA